MRPVRRAAGREGGISFAGMWSDDDDAIIGGDLTAALAYLTPAGGAVLTPVAPIGLRDRDAGTVTFTTSLGFGRKLERMRSNPRVALAYHAREHGFADGPAFVVVQGLASAETEPDRDVLEEEVRPASLRFMGPPKTGVFWDRWLDAYYADRVLVTVSVERVRCWPDGSGEGNPAVTGTPLPARDVPSQRPPAKGTGPSGGRRAGRQAAAGGASRAARLSGHGRHTESGFRAPANKTLLLLANGFLAKRGLKKAHTAARATCSPPRPVDLGLTAIGLSRLVVSGGGLRPAQPARTGLATAPRPSTSTSTVSPSRRKSPCGAAHPGGGARGDDVAGQQRDRAREPRDQLGRPEDEVRGRPLLDRLAVDPRAQPRGRRGRRPHRASPARARRARRCRSPCRSSTAGSAAAGRVR